MTNQNGHITILFATYNGGAVLPSVLEGYKKQDPDCNWDMVVVNNASTDGTADILKGYAQDLPLTVIEHADPGKNKALNAALPHVKGAFVIVTDDDAVPAPDFIAQWYKVAQTQKAYDLFGGCVEPVFQEAPPAWMADSRFHFEEVFAVRDLPDGPVAGRAIFGPNMAVRRLVFDEGVHFNEDIGPNGSNKNYPMGSETEFCTRVEGLGHKAYFCQGAKVQHIVRPHQIKKAFWTQRAYKHGLGFGLQERLSTNKASSSQKIMKRIKGRVKQFLCLIRYGLNIGDARKANENLWQYHWERGYYHAQNRL